MKFSHSLQFNAVPEWSSNYISYTALKKLIYSLQRESLRRNKDDLEAAHLISNEHNQSGSPSQVFKAALLAELKKVNNFFEVQERKVYADIDGLIADVNEYESSYGFAIDVQDNSLMDKLQLTRFESGGQRRRSITMSPDVHPVTTTDPETEIETEDENREHFAHNEISNAPNFGSANSISRQKSLDDYGKGPTPWNRENGNISSLPPRSALLSDSRIILRKRVIGMYTTLSELKSFIELNQTGFKKALKKFDKSLNTSMKDDFMSSLPRISHVFLTSALQELESRLQSLVEAYALVCSHGDDLEAAKNELSVHLREHVIWERNTVWRDMIGLERKSQAANLNSSHRSGGENLNTKGFSFRLSLTNSALLKLVAIVIVTSAFLKWSFLDDEAQRRCFALLVCASLLWATEAIPLFVTSLLIPLLIVNFRVLKDTDGGILDATESSKFILSTMWNSVILLLLGGFTLAASLTKFHIAKLLSTWILSKAGTNPSIVLLTIMGIALFASMWVSNVAAPVLCYSLIQPLLRTIDKGSPFTQALILGIAFASNIGGMASPIASPQNMIAIGEMSPPPSWGEWFVVSTPVCAVSLLLIWFFLICTFDCSSKTTRIIPIRTMDGTFTTTQYFISAVTLITITLWCFASKLTGVFGEMGIIALIPIILMFGTGLLTTEDFNNYPWNIVVLAMGGTALGKAVSSSGLLSTIAVSIQREVEHFSLFGVTLTFGLLILTMATFVSHTVAALIVVPLVSEIGNNLDNPRPRLLVMVSAFLCSAAMGLPTSGFPNVTAIYMTDDFGKPYLTVDTFITRGVPSSILVYAVIVSIGFVIMKMINL